MNEMIKTLQGQQNAIEDLAANLKKLNTVSTNRGQNVQPQPQFQQRQPRPDAGGDRCYQCGAPGHFAEIAQQEVDPHHSGTSPPGLHLTRQTSPISPPPPLLLRVRRQEGTVLAHLVPRSYLELSMREQLEVVQSLL